MPHLPTSSPRTPTAAPKVAIIGSGPGGLASAVLLAASGAKVTVFESQPVIGGRKPRLFLIYGEGNFIECQPDTPYLQIGERKYGKPILDRMIRFDTPLAEAVKVALISFSSTMRSNLAVGLPIDLVTVRSGVSAPELDHRITGEDAYYRELNERWSSALRAAAAAIPLPPYGEGPMQGSLV